MTHSERKATRILASIFALRMLGLFMIIPVFALYGQKLEGATPTLIGLAIGIYGLTQAVLQIPVGLWADRFNRKLLIVIGLVLFVIGGAVAALSHSIWGVIVGRAIQGAGAISAVVMALLADLTREEHRTKAMSTVGLSIGLSFAAAFIMGPFIAAHTGLSGLFWLTSLLAIVALVMLYFVPQPTLMLKQHNDSYWQQFIKILKHAELARLNTGVFILHFVMTACFVLLPHLLIEYAKIPANKHGWIYFPVVLIGFFAAVPAIIVAEKRQKIKQVFVFGISLMAVSLLILANQYTYYGGLLLGISLFFIAFNLLEALLPSLLSKISPAGTKATAMGIYASSQFFGAFLGGLCGGVLWAKHDISLAYVILAALTISWILLALFMKPPRFLQSMVMDIPHCNSQQASQLLTKLHAIIGVEEAVILEKEGVVYLKVDNKILDGCALHDAIYEFK